MESGSDSDSEDCLFLSRRRVHAATADGQTSTQFESKRTDGDPSKAGAGSSRAPTRVRRAGQKRKSTDPRSKINAALLAVGCSYMLPWFESNRIDDQYVRANKCGAGLKKLRDFIGRPKFNEFVTHFRTSPARDRATTLDRYRSAKRAKVEIEPVKLERLLWMDQDSDASGPAPRAALAAAAQVDMAPIEVDQADVPLRDSTDAQIVVKYKPEATHAILESSHRTPRLQPHPASAVVSSAFLGTPAPSYASQRVAKELGPAFQMGGLSALQHEGVCRANIAWFGSGCYDTGYRRGFLLGDQTGMGKGRQIAACIVNNWYMRGMRRAVWVSTQKQLAIDAKRDLDAVLLGVGTYSAPPTIQLWHDLKTHLPIAPQFKQGILFVTYSMLSRHWKHKCSLISEWLLGDGDGKDRGKACGTLVLDECHKTKNMLPPNSKAEQKRVDAARAEAALKEVIDVPQPGQDPPAPHTPCAKQPNPCANQQPPCTSTIQDLVEGVDGTKSGKCAANLQSSLPNACVLYASATSFSSVRNIAPMSRLCLWGQGTDFTDFYDLESTVAPLKSKMTKDHPGEVAMMEVVGRDLFARGLYVARMNSYIGVEFKVCQVKVSEGHRRAYDRAVATQWRISNAMSDLAQIIYKYGGITKSAQRYAQITGAVYWAMNQRFFKAITCAVKLRHAVEYAKRFLKEGNAIVFSLWSTGEARTNEMDVSGGLPEHTFIDAAAEMARHFVRSRFCANAIEREVDDFTVRDSFRREINKLRKELLDAIDEAQLEVFQNPIDYIKAEFGGEAKVAELTGRSNHWVKDIHGVKQFVKRESFDRRVEVNISEQRAFQRGEKCVAIVSSAASTGISLHSARDNPPAGRRRRINIVIELPWAADAAIQQMGRVHRTNQTVPPRYLILTSEIGGERRFVSALTSRLEALGALTRGDRAAAFAGGDHVNGESVFAGKNWQNKQAIKALNIIAYNLGFDNAVGARWHGRNLGRRSRGGSAMSQLSRDDALRREQQRADKEQERILGGSTSRDLVFPCVSEEKLGPTSLTFPKVFEPVLGDGAETVLDLRSLREKALNDLMNEVALQQTRPEEAKVDLDPVDFTAEQITNRMIQIILQTLIQHGLGGDKFFHNFERFANRALNLPFLWQQRLFGAFIQIFDEVVFEGRLNGTLEQGVVDIKAHDIKFVNRELLFSGSSTTALIRVKADYRTSFSKAVDKLHERRKFYEELRRDTPLTAIDRKVGFYGQLDGFYSWRPKSMNGDHRLRREVVLLIEELPIQSTLARRDANLLRSKRKTKQKFRVVYPHKKPGHDWTPSKTKSWNPRGGVKVQQLEVLLNAERDLNGYGHEIRFHPTGSKEVERMWTRQYNQAAGQDPGNMRGKCAQCMSCRRVPARKCESYGFMNGIVTHHLICGNVLHVWKPLQRLISQVPSAYRKDGTGKLGVLRCKVTKGKGADARQLLVVGVDVPLQVIPNLKKLLSDKQRAERAAQGGGQSGDERRNAGRVAPPAIPAPSKAAAPADHKHAPLVKTEAVGREGQMSPLNANAMSWPRARSAKAEAVDS